MKKKRLFVVETLGEVFYYFNLSDAFRNHSLGVSRNVLYKYPIGEKDYVNDVCVIKKRWVL